MQSEEYIWRTEVRGYELDNQNIVNNANYLHYFDNTRVKHLLSLGIDFDEYAKRGLNLVVVEIMLNFKAPLQAHDEFHVTSKFSRLGRILIGCEQKILRIGDNKLMTTADSQLTCVNVEKNRPCLPEEIIKVMFANTDK